MDERNFERIDRYLRKEMSPEESLNFEQDALNDSELRKETELTYRIKRSLTDRQQKLHKTAHWERKKKYKAVSFASVASIAAVLVVGFIMTKPIIEQNNNNEFVASAEIETAPEILQEKSREAVASVRKSISEGRANEAIAEVTSLEEQNVIPSLPDVADGRLMMSNNLESENVTALSIEAYELHWLKIQSLINVGKSTEAYELLKSFVKVEGKYKALADSLLNEFK